MARARSLTDAKERELVKDYHANQKTIAELVVKYGVSAVTVYRVLRRQGYDPSRIERTA